MEADKFAEINVYCRLKPAPSGKKPIKMKYDEEGGIYIEDGRGVSNSN
jgi:hypothetical protein